MQAKAIDAFAIQKRYQLQSVKEAISNNTMDLNEANNVLYKNAKEENAKLMKAVKGNRTNSVSRFMRKIKKINFELEREFNILVKSDIVERTASAEKSDEEKDQNDKKLLGQSLDRKRSNSPVQQQRSRQSKLKGSKSAMINPQLKLETKVVPREQSSSFLK